MKLVSQVLPHPVPHVRFHNSGDDMDFVPARKQGKPVGRLGDTLIRRFPSTDTLLAGSKAFDIRREVVLVVA